LAARLQFYPFHGRFGCSPSILSISWQFWMLTFNFNHFMTVLAAHLQFYQFHDSILASIHIWGQWSSYNRTWFIGPSARNSNSNSNEDTLSHLRTLSFTQFKLRETPILQQTSAIK
jgi:hypothetical protein